MQFCLNLLAAYILVCSDMHIQDGDLCQCLYDAIISAKINVA